MRKLILLLTLLAVISTVSATQYYVATNGLDTNNGTQPYSPFLTIKKGINTWTHGDWINISAGTYYEKTVALNALYNDKNDTRIFAANPGTVILTVNDTTCSRIFDLGGFNQTIEGLVINVSLTPAPQDFCEQGIYLRETRDDDRILNNQVYGTTTGAIVIVTSGASAHDRALIFNNTLSNNSIGIALTNAISNNSNISYNRIGVPSAGQGVYAASNGNQKGYNLSIQDNNFSFEGTSSQNAGHYIYFSGTSVGSGANNVSIIRNTFGNSTDGTPGYNIRFRFIRDIDVSYNQFWVFRSNNAVVYGENINNGINFTYNQYCDSDTWCNFTSSDAFYTEGSNNTLIKGNTVYTNDTEDGLYASCNSFNTDNTTMQDNVFFLLDGSNAAHVLGVGSEGTNKANYPLVKNNRFELINRNTAASVHALFVSSSVNGTVLNNRIEGGQYGLAAKLNVNVNWTGNQAYDNSLAGLYDKGSNNSFYKYNLVKQSLNGTYVAIAFGASAASKTNNATFTNNVYIVDEFSRDTLVFGQDANTFNVVSDNNTVYAYSNTTPLFLNVTTNYTSNQWRGIFSKDNNTRFYFDNRIQCALTVNDECAYYNYSSVD